MKFILTLRLTLTGRLTWTRPNKLPVFDFLSSPLVRLRPLFAGDAVQFCLNFLKSSLILQNAASLSEVVVFCDLIELVELHPSKIGKGT